MRVLVTGAGGYLGSQVVRALASARDGTLRPDALVAFDVRRLPPERRLANVEYVVGDIRDAPLARLMRDRGIDTVVHLAAIVTPDRKSDRAFEYSVDVGGTHKVLEACVAAGVRHLIVSSSGAAYGYHADNPPRLVETDPIRGNREFAYAWHKRLVEEMLDEYRTRHPQLKQTVFRIGTILGVGVSNQITALFDKRRPLAVANADSPFVFVWDEDVVGAIVFALSHDSPGIFNVAGDGTLTIHEIAARMGKRCRVLPAWLLQAALSVLHSLRLTRYGPEQLRFLRYRPVLDNRRLKNELGYVPRMTSSEVFDFWWAARNRQEEPER